MKLQYASFLIPVYPDNIEQDELNHFLRGHRVIQTRKELITNENTSNWAILVEYIDNQVKTTTENIKNKIDYKEILNIEDFSLFSKLREVRKKLAEEYGLPVYAVCTNEQLAEISTKKPNNLTEFMLIEGIGQSKAEKYVPALLECLKNNKSENSTTIV